MMSKTSGTTGTTTDIEKTERRSPFCFLFLSLHKSFVLYNSADPLKRKAIVDCHSEVPLFAPFFGFWGELHFVNKMV